MSSNNDFGNDLAESLTQYIAEGSDLPAAPATVYVTLYDDTGTELNADLQNGRVGVSTAGDWTVNGSFFENANEINFGEALADITVQSFALKDSDADDATATEFIRADITDAPQDFATETRVFFAAGDLDVNILDQND